jgi:hypothetical protein
VLDSDGIDEPSGIKKQLEEDQGISINFNNTSKAKDIKDLGHANKLTQGLEGRRANFSLMSGSKSTKRKKVSSF